MLTIDPCMKRTWAEVDLDAAARNYTYIRGQTEKNARVCCVVKANAYGHGAVELSRLYERMGADMLAVSNISEALQLRRAQIRLPILILGYTEPACASLLAKHAISQCVYSKEYGEALLQEAKAAGVSIPVHIKLDTGMGRIGFRYRAKIDTSLSEIPPLFDGGYLLPEGIFTHFASADEGESGREFTEEQFALFMDAVSLLTQAGLSFAIRHCANSAALLAYPHMHLDMVRAGLVLYGFSPVDAPLSPVMCLKSVVEHIKDVPAGDSISYGRCFVSPKPMRIATLPVGYADGYRRCDGALLVTWQKGERCVQLPVVGRICMDQLMVDVSEAPACCVGDEITLFGGGGAMSVTALAATCGTIPYEILCGVGERVPRIYVQNGEVVAVRDGLS